MSGWKSFLIGAICATGAWLYFHGSPEIVHTDPANSRQENSPLVGGNSLSGETMSRPGAAAPTAMAPPASGVCYLRTRVEVPNQYGKITYQPGTELRYIGQQGSQFVVEQGANQFTVSPQMVTDGLTAASGGMKPVAVTGSSDFGRCLLIVDGAEGEGSGCLVNFQGKTRVVTNAHVVSHITYLRFRQLNAREIVTGPFSFANGADLAVADQSSVNEGLELAEVDKEVQVGDDVVVLGNSQGSDVATQIKGTVKGIGPDLVEVDANFVPGNSGSPIIQVKTGKLIGIATFAQKKMDSLSQDSQFSGQWRRFGYRLDTVQSWEHPTPQAFAAEAKKVEAVHEQTMNLLELAQDIVGNRLNPVKYQAPGNRLREIVNDLAESKYRDSASEAEARERFIRAIVFETHEDTDSLRRQDFTWYHWHALQYEIDARKFLQTAFERALQGLESRDQMLH